MAILEGDCAASTGSEERIAFCVAYEVTHGRVSAMRLYGQMEAAIGDDG